MKAEALGLGVGYQQRRPSKPGWHGHDQILCEKKEPLERSYRIQTSSFYILGYRQAGGKYLLYIDLCFLPLVSPSFIVRELKKIICNQNLGPIFKLLMTSAKKSTEVIRQIARERHVEFRARNVHSRSLDRQNLLRNICRARTPMGLEDFHHTHRQLQAPEIHDRPVLIELSKRASIVLI
jgi:hypothetical protein